MSLEDVPIIVVHGLNLMLNLAANATMGLIVVFDLRHISEISARNLQ
jgi:hypothetical protein